MFLGIDLGTSGVKTLLIDENQAVVVSTTAPLEVSRPNSGWSEQDPQDWIEATGQAMEALKSSHPRELAAVKSIGLSGQMHGATLLDSADQVLRPCMLWNDTRSDIEARSLDENPDFRAISGNIVFPGFTAPKVNWVQNHEPATFEKITKILLPKDYLRLWLTGEHVSEMSDASGTSWLDVGARDWSDRLLSACDLDRSHMPILVEGSAASGMLRAELAAQWGIGQPVIVAGGAGDNAASAIGMGTINGGDAFVSLGTSGVVFSSTDSYLPRPQSAVHAFCHCLPQKWHQMGVILSASDALSWYAGITGLSPEQLTGELGDSVEPPSQVVFLPYLSGERTPHNDARIRGAFIGLEHGSDRKQLTRAVLAGICFALRDNLMALKQAGTELSALTAVGGGSRSKIWLKLMATILNLPVIVPKDGEFGAAFGAARLAILASGDHSADDICLPPQTKMIIEPEQSMVGAYDDAYQRYRALYPQIKGI